MQYIILYTDYYQRVCGGNSRITVEAESIEEAIEKSGLMNVNYSIFQDQKLLQSGFISPPKDLNETICEHFGIDPWDMQNVRQSFFFGKEKINLYKNPDNINQALEMAIEVVRECFNEPYSKISIDDVHCIENRLKSLMIPFESCTVDDD